MARNLDTEDYYYYISSISYRLVNCNIISCETVTHSSECMLVMVSSMHAIMIVLQYRMIIRYNMHDSISYSLRVNITKASDRRCHIRLYVYSIRMYVVEKEDLPAQSIIQIPQKPYQIVKINNFRRFLHQQRLYPSDLIIR